MDLRELLHLSLPLIQAPMAGVQGSEMAIAVSEAGGLGSLPCAMLTPSALREELTRIKARTSKPYNVNFFCHAEPKSDPAREASWRKALSPYYAELGVDPGSVSPGPARKPFDQAAADILAEFRPPVVSFHFGLPSKELLDRVRKTGAKILSSATTLKEALWLEEQGVDAVIAQGVEAGGHRGNFLTEDLGTQTGTVSLVRQLLVRLTVPVIAAGGIADAHDVAGAMKVGVAGVQIGTAFLLCPEATTSPVHRAALANHDAFETALTNVFSGRPARGIMNRAMRELGPMSGLAPAFPLASAAIAPLRAAAERKGSGDFSPLWSGTNPSGCRETPAGTLLRQLAGLE